jgi:hypothetical protein
MIVGYSPYRRQDSSTGTPSGSKNGEHRVRALIQIAPPFWDGRYALLRNYIRTIHLADFSSGWMASLPSWSKLLTRGCPFIVILRCPSLHVLTKRDQLFVGSLKVDQPGSRILDIQHDVNDDHGEYSKSKDVHPASARGRCHSITGEQ